MISEQELAKLSYPEMPKIVSNELPGPKSRQVIDDALKVQTPTRPSVRGTLVIEEGFGAGIKDPDDNVYIDLSAGVAVSSVGRNQWRAQIKRIPGGSGALMPFYGKTPDEAASLLTRWLAIANGRPRAEA